MMGTFGGAVGELAFDPQAQLCGYALRREGRKLAAPALGSSSFTDAAVVT